MALALVGQAAGTVERDHVARVTRGATNRAHRLEADCHGSGEAADITAPADATGDGGQDQAARALPGIAPAGPAQSGSCVWLPQLSPRSLVSWALTLDSIGRAPPAA